ncbi:hypothetical protein [Terribacillus saccharophilus]|uniref:hypothetical protein n=1 Tax=Terribacillus saccharophilus TaxID=361277 RepID=UPI002989C50F|nr:hypothetical protein [Terribacillus saccharophilus]MCM3227550.1 hypothetical protein [Terribacillus saccharophilus]
MLDQKVSLTAKIIIAIVVLILIGGLIYMAIDIHNYQEEREERAIELEEERHQAELYWTVVEPRVTSVLANYLELDEKEIVIHNEDLSYVENNDELAETWFTFTGYDTDYRVLLNNDLSINKVIKSERD